MIRRSVKKAIVVMIALLAMVIGIFLFIEHIRWDTYEKEYNSTNWYEVTAEYDSCRKHTERELVNDTVRDESYYESVDYYDWYYHYTAEDGSVHTYVEKDNSFEPSGNPKVTILVDEKDPSHSLKPQSKENHQWAVRTTLIIILTGIVPMVVSVIAAGAFIKLLRESWGRYL